MCMCDMKKINDTWGTVQISEHVLQNTFILKETSRLHLNSGAPTKNATSGWPHKIHKSRVQPEYSQIRNWHDL